MTLSAIAGIFSGVGGSLITNIFNFFNSKQKNKHELAMGELRIKEMQAESDANIKEIEIQSEIQKELAAQESFNISQKYGNKSLVNSEMIKLLFESKWTAWLGSILVFVMGIVDIIRAFIRPGITIVLMYITGYITYQHLQILDANQALLDQAMLMMVVESIIYLTFTVVGWWFGDRTIAKYLHKK